MSGDSIKPIRIPIYCNRNKLLGYWYLRKCGQDYLISFKYPGQEFRNVKLSSPDRLVSVLYDSFIGYLGRQYIAVRNTIASLPPREYHKRGFRRGWLSKLKSNLELRRSSLINEGKQFVEDKLKRLKLGGWPIPPMPPLPWDKKDERRTERIDWATAGNSAVIHRGPAINGCNRKEDVSKPLFCTPYIGKERSAHQGQRLLQSKGRPASQGETITDRQRATGNRFAGAAFTQRVGQEIRDIKGTSQTVGQELRDGVGSAAATDNEGVPIKRKKRRKKRRRRKPGGVSSSEGGETPGVVGFRDDGNGNGHIGGGQTTVS
jgi:hypothetical protein